MEKKNTNTDSLSKLLSKRWSPRQFDDQQISKKTIFQIFDAGKTSMSCFNEQPWRVILASKDDPHYNKLFECLTSGNQQWVQTAPFLGVVLVKKHFSKKDKETDTASTTQVHLWLSRHSKPLALACLFTRWQVFRSKKFIKTFRSPMSLKP